MRGVKGEGGQRRGIKGEGGQRNESKERVVKEDSQVYALDKLIVAFLDSNSSCFANPCWRRAGLRGPDTLTVHAGVSSML